jgi:DNA polymerase
MTAMDQALLRNLKELVALDVELGLGWAGRPASSASASPVPAAASAAASSATTTVAAASAANASVADEPVRIIHHPAFAAGEGPSIARLDRIAQAAAACKACSLCQERQHCVPGEGNANAELLFIGEGPGADEDRSGRPFVGPAGQLLDKMIVAMGFSRAEVFIANIVKCRPPGNREPSPTEMSACLPFLRAQISAIRPKLIVTLGNTPLRALTGDLTRGITRSRGSTFTFDGVTCLPTFHPSYLLRNEAAKKPAWEDLKAALKFLGREAPRRG